MLLQLSTLSHEKKKSLKNGNDIINTLAINIVFNDFSVVVVIIITNYPHISFAQYFFELFVWQHFVARASKKTLKHILRKRHTNKFA